MVSGTRAEFGLLKNVIAGIEASNSLQLEFVVTGSHLSPEFGMTGDEIGESGLPVSRRVEMLLSSDSSIGMAKSLGWALWVLLMFLMIFNQTYCLF